MILLEIKNKKRLDKLKKNENYREKLQVRNLDTWCANFEGITWRTHFMCPLGEPFNILFRSGHVFFNRKTNIQTKLHEDVFFFLIFNDWVSFFILNNSENSYKLSYTKLPNFSWYIHGDSFILQVFVFIV